MEIFYYIIDFWATRWVLGTIKIATESWDDAFQDLIFWSTCVDLLVNTHYPSMISMAWKLHFTTMEKVGFVVYKWLEVRKRVIRCLYYRKWQLQRCFTIFQSITRFSISLYINFHISSHLLPENGKKYNFLVTEIVNYEKYHINSKKKCVIL